MDESPTRSPEPRCILFVNGAVRVDSATQADAFRRTKEALGHLLQVRNLAVLVGAGASFHLGAPAIRHLSLDDIRALVTSSGIELSDAADALLASLCGDEPTDLEALLASLSSIISFASAVSVDEVKTVDGRSFSRDASTSLRLALNRALAHACDIPQHTPGEPHLPDQWRVHGAFFQRLLRARRGDLARVKIFTTNYDTVIENSLDASGIAYIDGFVGTVRRTFAPRVYEQEVFLPGGADERRLLRLEDIVSLHKLHGSIDWRSSDERSGTEIGSVFQGGPAAGAGGDDLALIYPTPHKELDVLGYPYAELFRGLASALNVQETALLVCGYSFSDAHINRIIFEALASNPTLQLFVADPFAVLEKKELSDGAKAASDPDAAPIRAETLAFRDNAIARLAQIQDARIAVLTGEAATFENLATELLPNPDALILSEDDPDHEALRRALVDVVKPPAE